MRTQLEATMAQLTELQLNTLCQVRIRLQAVSEGKAAQVQDGLWAMMCHPVPGNVTALH